MVAAVKMAMATVAFAVRRAARSGVGMIWLAWLNGTLYLEIHGRQDGRTRAVVFVQMGILVLLAVFAGGATTSRGRRVRGHLRGAAPRHDLAVAVGPRAGPARVRGHHARLRGGDAGIDGRRAAERAPARRRPAGRLGGAHRWLGDRLPRPRAPSSRTFAVSVTPTESMVERFGLFTIIVLGEVVIGVVDGLSARGHRRALDRHRAAGPGDRVRVLVGVLRRRRPADATDRGPRDLGLDDEPAAHHPGHRGLRRGDGQPHRACARPAHAADTALLIAARSRSGSSRSPSTRRRSRTPAASRASTGRSRPRS